MASRPYAVLHKIRHQARDGIVLRFSPIKAPFTKVREILEDHVSAATFKVQDEYERRPADRLAWQVITNVSAKEVPQAIVRNRLKRIYASAFGKALKKQGYHDNGQERINAVQRKDRPPGDLKGTLEIYVFSKSVLDAYPRRLLQDARAMVDAVRQHQKNVGDLARISQYMPRIRQIGFDGGKSPNEGRIQKRTFVKP